MKDAQAFSGFLLFSLPVKQALLIFIGVVGITYFSVCRESAVQEMSVRPETKSRMSLLVSLLYLREWLPKPKLGHELKLGC